MRKCYLDSNILIYLKDEDSPYHKRVFDLLSKLISQKVLFFISPLVLDEFYFTFLYGLRVKHIAKPYDKLKRAATEILMIPSLQMVNPPSDADKQLEVISYMERYHLRSRDAYHLLITQTNNIDSLATFDKDFNKVFAAKLLEEV